MGELREILGLVFLNTITAAGFMQHCQTVVLDNSHKL
jgi:hypothetical protein